MPRFPNCAHLPVAIAANFRHNYGKSKKIPCNRLVKKDIIRRESSNHFLPPFFFRNTIGERDGTCGTDEAAEVATHALCSNETGLARLTVEDNGLMTAIATGNLTTATTHTFLAVNLGIDNGIAVKVGGLHKRGQQLTNQV